MYKYLLLLTLAFSSHAWEKADAFIVTAFPGHYKVLSPVKLNKKISLIIQNKTNSKMYGKLVTSSKEVFDVSVKATKSKSIEFNFNKKEKYYFIPISPPFQKVELRFGEKSYEVPAKRKDR